jgi:hypothetical protein
MNPKQFLFWKGWILPYKNDKFVVVGLSHHPAPHIQYESAHGYCGGNALTCTTQHWFTHLLKYWNQGHIKSKSKEKGMMG